MEVYALYATFILGVSAIALIWEVVELRQN